MASWLRLVSADWQQGVISGCYQKSIFGPENGFPRH